MVANIVRSKLRGTTVGRTVRAVRRLLRHGPDRLLHRLRRQLAAVRLRRRRTPESVLFVCHGNICRSPYAAAALERALPPRSRPAVRVDSAGFLGSGRRSPPEAVEAAARRDIDLSAHRSMSLLPELGRLAELIVVMDARQRRAIRHRFGRRLRDVILLGDLDPAPISTRAIRDPVNGSSKVFDACYARIDRALGVLAGALTDGTDAAVPAAGVSAAPRAGSLRVARSSTRPPA